MRGVGGSVGVLMVSMRAVVCRAWKVNGDRPLRGTDDDAEQGPEEPWVVVGPLGRRVTKALSAAQLLKASSGAKLAL